MLIQKPDSRIGKVYYFLICLGIIIALLLVMFGVLPILSEKGILNYPKLLAAIFCATGLMFVFLGIFGRTYSDTESKRYDLVIMINLNLLLLGLTFMIGGWVYLITQKIVTLIILFGVSVIVGRVMKRSVRKES